MNKWSRKYDACRECGTSERPHHSLGLCLRCYNKTPKRLEKQKQYYRTYRQKTAVLLFPMGCRVWAHYTNKWLPGTVVDRGDGFATVRLDGGITIIFTHEGFSRLRRDLLTVIKLPPRFEPHQALAAVDYLAYGFTTLEIVRDTGLEFSEVEQLAAIMRPMTDRLSRYCGFVRQNALYEIREQWTRAQKGGI